MRDKRFARIGRVGAASIIAGGSVLVGVAAWGGLALSSAAGPPVNYACANVSGQINLANTSAPQRQGAIFMNSNVGSTKAVSIANETDDAGNMVPGTITNGQYEIGIVGGAAVQGETAVINKLTYTVAAFQPNQDILTGGYPDAPYAGQVDGVLILDTPITGLTVSKPTLPVATKITINPTTTASGINLANTDFNAYLVSHNLPHSPQSGALNGVVSTTAYTTGNTQEASFSGDGCSINTTATGLDFYPTDGATFNAAGVTGAFGNGVLGLLTAPALSVGSPSTPNPYSGTYEPGVTYPSDSSYQATDTPNTKNGGLETLTFSKAGSFVDTNYVWAGGSLTGNLKTSGEELSIGLNGFVVCTVDQWANVENHGANIDTCDGGADNTTGATNPAAELTALEGLLTGVNGAGSDGSLNYALVQVDLGEGLTGGPGQLGASCTVTASGVTTTYPTGTNNCVFNGS